MVSIITQFAQWIGRNPAAAQVLFTLGKGTVRAFERMSPESKAKVVAVIRWGVERAARYTLTTVLGEVGGKVVDLVADPTVAEFAKAVVERGVEIGVEAALKEARATA